ncbi:hypothetical protein MASR2M12_26920 [Bacteroidales bacterium]
MKFIMRLTLISKQMNRIFKRIMVMTLLGLFVWATPVLAKGKAKKTETVEIKTSAVCSQCKDRLEKNIAFEKGVRDVRLDLDTKVLSITFKKGKNSKDKLKKAVTSLGYDADELEADAKAYDRLPACCKKDAPPH